MSSDGNSGVFWMMSGLTVLVMTGVGFSLLVDRHFKFSSNSGNEQRMIAADAGELVELTDSKTRKQAELDRTEIPRKRDQKDLEKLTERLSADGKRLEILRQTAAATKAANDGSATAFASYRSNYRKQVWEAAAGQQLPFIALKNGRRYEKVAITRVTAAGLEITHTEGRARIDANDLDATWQDRFQWNDAERQALLTQERRDMESIAPPAAAKPVEAVTGSFASDAVLAEKVQKLRLELIAWNQQVSTLATQHSEATSQSYNRENPSVPGSLETWAARANRLAGDLSKARTAQSQTRSQLRAVAPDDPLLKEHSYR